MDKKHLHHLWTLIRPLNVWYLLVLTLIAVGVAVVSLRSNNLTMLSLRNEVQAADKNNGDVEGSLQRLRSFVYGHMNTSLYRDDSAVYPPIQLQYTFQRLKQAEEKRAQDTNSQVYSDAQTYCEKLYPGSFSGGPRVPCIEQYVSSHGVKPKSIPNALYKFDFVSPRWSPDLAGFSVVMAVLLSLVLILRVAAGLLLRHLAR